MGFGVEGGIARDVQPSQRVVDFRRPKVFWAEGVFHDCQGVAAEFIGRGEMVLRGLGPTLDHRLLALSDLDAGELVEVHRQEGMLVAPELLDESGGAGAVGVGLGVASPVGVDGH